MNRLQVFFCFLLISCSRVVLAQDKDNDTLKARKIVPIAKIHFRNPGDIFPGLNSADSLKPDPFILQTWDPLELVSGFVQGLGQPGKPYCRYEYGLPEKYTNPLGFVNPFTGQPSIWMDDPIKDRLYLDTRTPFVKVRFTQASKKMQNLSLIFSQNFTPQWNFTADYARRTSEGFYVHNQSDHYNIHVNQSYVTLNKRYSAFLTMNFDQLSDGINGGIYQDGTIPFEDSFNKLLQKTSLENAKIRNDRKGISTFQIFRFAGDTTASGFKGLIKASAGYSKMFNQFEDLAYAYVESPYPVYPSLYGDSSSIQAAWKGHTVEYKSELIFNYSNEQLALKSNFSGFGNQSRFSWKDTLIEPTTTGAAFELGGILEENSVKLGLEIVAEKTVNSLQPDGFSSSIQLFSAFKKDSKRHKIGLNEKVSSYFENFQGLSLNAGIHFRQLPPSLSTLYFSTPTYLSISSLQNESIYRGHFGLRYMNDSIKTLKKGVLPGFLNIEFSLAAMEDPILLNDKLLVYQINNQSINWISVNVGGRLRIARWYLEGTVSAQKGNTSGSADGLKAYAENLPFVIGKAKLYYCNSIFKNAANVRTGFEFTGQSAANLFFIDPVTQQFYPGNTYESPQYLRTDVFVSARIKNAAIFLKMVNLTEGWFAPGYYTTTLYPMMGRTFSFGIEWNFFD
jgi:hypothetical protein